MLGLLGPVGGPEMLIILAVALLLFGGRLPDVARSIGRSVADFKKGLRDIRDDFDLGDDRRYSYRPPQPQQLPAPRKPAPVKHPSADDADDGDQSGQSAANAANVTDDDGEPRA